jgi:hypothetical protein
VGQQLHRHCLQLNPAQRRDSRALVGKAPVGFSLEGLSDSSNAGSHLLQGTAPKGLHCPMSKAAPAVC